MTNTEAQKVLVTMLMRYVMTDPEMEALVMAGEALDEKITEERHKGEEALRTEKRPETSLIELRHEAEENGVTVQHQAGFNFGWNACLDAILGEEEE